MVRALLALVASVVAVLSPRRVPLLELAGVTCAVVGLTVLFGAGAGWLAVAVALLGKSLEADLAGKDTGSS